MNIPTVNNTLNLQEFYILLAITNKTLHGYGIRAQVAYDSESSVVMATGTVYGILKRLVTQGLVRKVEVDDQRGRIACRYELTEYGARRLENEVRRIENVTRHARYKLALVRRK